MDVCKMFGDPPYLQLSPLQGPISAPRVSSTHSSLREITVYRMASFDIPKQQQAAVRQGSGDSATATIQKIDVPSPAPGQILVKINWSGLCASDKSLIHDE